MEQTLPDSLSRIDSPPESPTETHSGKEAFSPLRATCLVYMRIAVARLTCEEIEGMSVVDLIRTVRNCRALALRPEVNRQLQYFERPTLERLIYILRRSFRERLTCPSRQRTMS